MEASAILKMVEYAFYNRFFIIDAIVSNDDRTMQAVLKHPSKVFRGQFLKSSKVKLDEEIPEPYFLAYPSHRVKVVDKHIFSIVNKSRAQRYGCTKADALRFNKHWGYMKNNNRGETIEELSEASKVSLEHIFNSHDNCSAYWCFKTRASDEVNTYNETDDRFCCKQNYNQLYNLLKKTIFPSQTDKVLK